MSKPGGIGCDRAVVDALQDQVAADTAIINAKNAEIKRLTAEVGILKRLVYLWVDPCVVDPEDEKLVMNCVEFVNSAVSKKGG